VSQLVQEQAEPLALQRRRRDLAALIRLPEPLVDVPVRLEDGLRVRQAETPERRLQRDALGAIGIEERVVEVEEDGAGRRQERRLTSRGR